MRSANARMPSTSSSVDRLGVVVNLRQRQLLAELVALAAVGVAVDRFRIQKRLVKPVEFQADGLEPSFLFGGSLSGRGALLLPDVENAVLDDPHVAGRRLQQGQFVRERAFQFGLAHVDRPASARAVVVRVAAVPALRPAAGERASARFAAHEAAQREVRMVSLAWRSYRYAAVE